MFQIIKSWVVFFLVLNASVFALNVNFTSPSLTTPGTPNLATLGEETRIAAGSDFVYAIWKASTSNVGPIQVAISADSGITWTAPIQLAASGKSPKIVTDSSGQFSYAVWFIPSVNAIQISRSSNFGVNWSTPIDLTTATGGSDLNIETDSNGKNIYVMWNQTNGEVQVVRSSNFGENWSTPLTLASSVASSQITTDSTGKYVYAIWRNASTQIIQISISPDFGVSWTIHFNSADKGDNPQITTDSTGRYVYAIWDLSLGIQTVFSSDFGITWQNPISTPTGISPNLANMGINPQITTDNSGRYVYAIWNNLFLGGNVQTAFSSDFGVTWQNPTSTPTGTTPDLAFNGENTHITTDNTGRYVYVIWNEPSGAVQTAFSSNFGITWQNPTSTPTGIAPNLASSGENSQIITDKTGENIHAIWNVSAGAVQEANGFKTFFPLNNVTINR